MSNLSEEDCISSSDDEWMNHFDKKLNKIFKKNNVELLKQKMKLEDISPDKIYEMLGGECFSDRRCPVFENRVNSIDCFKYLVEQGLDINIKNFDGITPLLHACMYNNDEAIFYILENGGDPNIGKRGITSIHSYFGNGGKNIEVIKKSIEKGFDVKHVDCNGVSCIHNFPSEYDDNFLCILDLFINNRFDINIKDKNGNTFLHNKNNTRKINENLIRELHKRGFNFNAKNKKEVSVIDSLKGYPNIEEMKQLIFQLDQEEINGNIKDTGCD